MMLNTRTRYAVMAMVELSARGGRVTLAELAAAQSIPQPYLEQIFAGLRKAGLVRARSGPGGGYALSRPASDIVIADIVAAAEEPVQMTRCGGKQSCTPSHARCATHDLWEGLENHIEEYLRGIPLDSIAGPGRACAGGFL